MSAVRFFPAPQKPADFQRVLFFVHSFVHSFRYYTIKPYYISCATITLLQSCREMSFSASPFREESQSLLIEPHATEGGYNRVFVYLYYAIIVSVAQYKSSGNLQMNPLFISSFTALRYSKWKISYCGKDLIDLGLLLLKRMENTRA